MKNFVKDTLRDIVTQALDNGWTMREFGVKESSEDIIQNLDWYLDNLSLNDIAFSFGFAKAYFGTKLIKIAKNKYRPEWKIALAKLATRKNKINYLKHFLKTS